MSEAPRQITDLAELAGKTIARATRADHSAGIAIVFTDGTYYFTCSIHRNDGPIDIQTDYRLDLRERTALGVATPGEIEEAREQARVGELRAQEYRERKDRRAYERLKAKFEQPRREG